MKTIKSSRKERKTNVAYQHIVIRTRENNVQAHLDKWGPRGFRVVSLYRRPGNLNKVTLVLEAKL